MFSDNVQVSQSPTQHCLSLHAHSELFPAVPHEADHDKCCTSNLVNYTLSIKTWLIKPHNVTKSSKMGPHVI